MKETIDFNNYVLVFIIDEIDAAPAGYWLIYYILKEFCCFCHYLVKENGFFSVIFYGIIFLVLPDLDLLFIKYDLFVTAVIGKHAFLATEVFEEMQEFNFFINGIVIILTVSLFYILWHLWYVCNVSIYNSLDTPKVLIDEVRAEMYIENKDHAIYMFYDNDDFWLTSLWIRLYVFFSNRIWMHVIGREDIILGRFKKLRQKALTIRYETFFHNSFNHHTTLEILWTILPAILVLVLIIPSVRLLVLTSTTTDCIFTYRIIGHQWFWSYQYPNYTFKSIDKFLNYSYEVESRIKEEHNLRFGERYLLSTTKKLIIPIKEFLRVAVTATDVIHSWAVPQFGIKIDAVPGRLNQKFINVTMSGFYYGQCSELCGIDHSQMPIAICGFQDKIFIYKYYKQ